MAEKLQVDLILKDKDFKRGINSASKDIQKLGKVGQNSTMNISNGFKAIGAAIIAMGLKNLIVDLAKTAATGQAVKSAFFNAFDDSDLKVLRKSVKGTVSDLSLMQRAIKAKDFGIPLEVMAKGLQLAKIKAQETGESVDYMVNSFVTGLGRESPLILDNLSIKTSELNAEIKKTGDFMTAVSNVTERMLKESGGNVSQLADDFGRVSAELENAKLAASMELLPAFLTMSEKMTAAIPKITTELNIAINKLKKMAEIAQFVSDLLPDINSGGGQEALIQKTASDFKILNGNSVDFLKTIEQLEDALVASFDNPERIEIIGSAIRAIKKEQEDATSAVWKMLKARHAELGIIDKIRKESKKLTEEQIKAAKALKDNLAATLSKIQIERDAEFNSLSSGFGSGFQLDASPTSNVNTNSMMADLPEGESVVIAQIKTINEGLSEGQMLALDFTSSLTDGLFDAAIAGENFHETMDKFLQNLIVQFAKMIAKAIMFQVIMSIATSGGSTVAGAGGGFLGGLFGRNAQGTNNFGGGMSLVGEHGPEMVTLPQGSSVASAGRTRGMMDGISINGMLRGSDILLSGSRTKTNRAR